MGRKKKDTKNFKTNLALACAKDEYRPALQYVVFKDGKAWATNAYVAVKHDLTLHCFDETEISNMEGKAIHKELFKKILSFDKVYAKEDGFLCENEGVSLNVPYNEMPLKYPDVSKVFEDRDSIDLNVIGFNPDNMKTALRLVYDKDVNVSVDFAGYNTGMVIMSMGLTREEEEILLMPVILDSDEKKLKGL